jgi:hypothetical protein
VRRRQRGRELDLRPGEETVTLLPLQANQTQIGGNRAAPKHYPATHGD